MFYKLRKAITKKVLKIKLRVAKIKKLNIGAGTDGANKEYSDWVATDIEMLDITNEKNWSKLLGDAKLDNILAEHVWEHLTDEHTFLANKNCYKFLKKGGKLRIAVPDGFHNDPKYVEAVQPGGSGLGSDDHKILYNYKIMKERLESVGFKVELLEYWDENQEFHHVPWDIKHGPIKRSKEYDIRNKDGKLGYTSLIIDAIK